MHGPLRTMPTMETTVSHKSHDVYMYVRLKESKTKSLSTTVKRFAMAAALPAVVAMVAMARGDLDYSRTHIVDVFHPLHDGPPNLLVRSNMPTNATDFGATTRHTA